MTPNVESRTEPTVDGPVALSAFIGNSKKGNMCFVKQLTKFVSGQPLDPAETAQLQGLADGMMRPEGSIRDVLVGVVTLQATKP